MGGFGFLRAMQSSNPVFRRDPFVPSRSLDGAMTIQGAVGKTAVLLVLALITGSATWTLAQKGAPVWPFCAGAGLLGFLIAIALMFKQSWSPVLAPVYGMLEGIVLGGVSAGFEQQYPGIVVAAAGATVATLAALLFAYQSGLIRATESFKRGVIIATMGIALFYLVMMVLGFFGIQMPAINGSGLLGIGFSVVVVVIAALNLVIDFDAIEQGARAGAPKYMEWYAAFGLMVTLVWLYFEILRLLAKLSNRR
jgi:uncharacterized YccA/Bax inhibitor family protein